MAWITIFSLTSSVSGLRIFTHNETNPFETKPQVWQYGKYFDGTVVIRIINMIPNKTSSTTKFWVRPVLSLRIIHPNGTVSEIDKNLGIQEFNWHITKISFDDFQDPVSIFSLQKGYLLVTYYNASNPDDINTYEEWGRIIDWNGNLYDEVYFSKAYIENGTWYTSATKIVTNVDPEKGFIRISGRAITYIEWQQYTIDDSSNLKRLYKGNITFPQKDGSIIKFSTVPTTEEGYSIILGNSTGSFNSSNNSPLEISAAVYVLTKGYNDKQFSAPKMIYQSPLENIKIDDLFCDLSSTGIGQICTLSILQFNLTGYFSMNYVKFNFLSSGSITEIIPLRMNTPIIGASFDNLLIEIIPYGGYFYCFFSGKRIYGYYFNEIDSEFQEWDFQNPSYLNARRILIILPNNTILLPQIEDYNTWSFNTSDIPKFTDLDKGYSNFQVNSTSPSINANISTSMKNITITYYEPVELSYGNISIYQIDNSGSNIIRQFVNGVNSFCSISDDGLTVTVKVIKSTFSNPNSLFYVKVYSNFARSQAYREPLRGIYENIWKFNTNPSEETFADTVSGVLRLTIEGTEYYENLNTTGKDQFFTDLHLELSKIIPVNMTRLRSTRKTQVDTTVSPNHQILISLNIESSKEERSVASIVGDLNDMITYKNMTSISLFSTTKYLDENYGFKPKLNLWNEYKWKFLSVILVLVILVILFLIAKKMESKGHNMAILQLGLIIFDFVMDVLFVSENGKVIEVLFIPSIVFLTVPIGINTIWAFYIISDENKSKTFLDWFIQHQKVASVFTILSSADIETLSILHSNLAGFKFFQAPISTKGKNRIFWVSCVTIFVEDIPQVIVQLIYHFSVVTYDIIPLLALVSSCLSLLINIIGRLFQAINSCRSGTSKYDSTQNQDDFESLQQLQTPSTERTSTSDGPHAIDVKEDKEKNSEKINLTKRSSQSSIQEVIN
ncbi:hypothetical protein Glove_109g274 [Diversispora epigaea]|uniref:SbsA Ig-like domain-containing protein n=1 Tax=Diversispora epigaea TaxID=1348612 RepID=A0A397J8W8_9GLOM|nr:hypothetical protein Glove_109g274 [Diversispora epigaea]